MALLKLSPFFVSGLCAATFCGAALLGPSCVTDDPNHCRHNGGDNACTSADARFCDGCVDSAQNGGCVADIPVGDCHVAQPGTETAAAETSDGTSVGMQATGVDDGTGGDDGTGADDRWTTAGGASDADADAGADTDADETDTGPSANPVAFRFTAFDVRDPHFFADTVLGCTDVTDEAPLGMPGLNDTFNDALAADVGPDENPDGNFDFGLVLSFSDLTQVDGAEGSLALANAQCPTTGADCGLLPTTVATSMVYVSRDAGSCDALNPADLSGYVPAPGMTPAPCFTSAPETFEIRTPEFSIPLEDLAVAATYQEDPATALITGTLRGFLTTSAAEGVVLLRDLQASTGATTLAGILAGHRTSCAVTDDRDGDGWWVHVDFVAEPVGWVG